MVAATASQIARRKNTFAVSLKDRSSIWDRQVTWGTPIIGDRDTNDNPQAPKDLLVKAKDN